MVVEERKVPSTGSGAGFPLGLKAVGRDDSATTLSYA